LFLKKETYLELKGKDLKSSPEKIVGIIDKKKEIKKIALDDFNSGLNFLRSNVIVIQKSFITDFISIINK